MMKKNKRNFLLALFSFCSCVSSAQHRYATSLDTVKQTGFYKIMLTPELSVHCKADFADIRIKDEKGNAVSYIIRNSFPYLYNQLFSEFPIISNTLTDSGRSAIIIENKFPDAGITDFSLLLKNSAVERSAQLSGSTDKIHWYIISENLLLTKSQEINNESYLQPINFPYSKYRYFKLLVNNSNTDPLNIVKAGRYIRWDMREYPRPFVYNPAAEIKVTDSAKRTYINLQNDTPYPVERIELQVSGPKFYERTISLYKQPPSSSLNRFTTSPLASFSFSSNDTNPSFDIPRTKLTGLMLVIDNKDNPPLTIQQVHTLQLQKEIVAYLEKGGRYSFLLDDSTVTAPNYDLEKFRDSIPITIETIGIGKLTAQPKEPETIQKIKADWWIWPSIIMAIAMLGFLCYKLISDMKKTTTST